MAEYHVPNKLNYTVIAGAAVWIAKITNDIAGDYLPVGNLAEDPTLSFNLERWQHNTHQYGVDTRDRNVVIGKAMSFKIVLDELIRENLKYCLGASSRTVGQTVAIRRYEKITLTAGSGQVNSGAIIVDIENIFPNSGEEVYVEGATGDYTVTEATGTITVTGGSQIGQTDTIIVCYRANKTCVEYPIMDSPNISAAVQFISTQSHAQNIGYNYLLDLPNCDISLDGDIALNRKEAVKASLLCEVLADATNPSGGLGMFYTFQAS